MPSRVTYRLVFVPEDEVVLSGVSNTRQDAFEAMAVHLIAALPFHVSVKVTKSVNMLFCYRIDNTGSRRKPNLTYTLVYRGELFFSSLSGET